jgi:hypothetical protein
LSAENLVLRQAIDALARHVFGVSGEKLDAKQLEFLLDADAAKNAPAADPADHGPAADIEAHKKRPQKTRAPSIPDHLPVQRGEVIPAEGIRIFRARRSGKPLARRWTSPVFGCLGLNSGVLSESSDFAPASSQAAVTSLTKTGHPWRFKHTTLEIRHDRQSSTHRGFAPCLRSAAPARGHSDHVRG